jgi:hypothetical protein
MTFSVWDKIKMGIQKILESRLVQVFSLLEQSFHSDHNLEL